MVPIYTFLFTDAVPSQTNPEGEARVTFIGTEPVYDFLNASDKLAIAIQDSGHCDISG